jgi:NAD(P)-dependent dehydrogenase (short-subunit alcohol dehydrogenase family)
VSDAGAAGLLDGAFAGSVALVTGAAGETGARLVARLLAAGARVGVIDRRSGRVAPRAGLEVATADLADTAATAAAVARLAATQGAVDHVFNVAGGYAGGQRVEETPEEVWRRLWESSFLSTLNVCRAVVPAMRERGSGTVVNVGSRASLAGGARAAAYSVAKSAVLRLTESLAAEQAGTGVRVHCVLPGTIDTAANRAAMPEADRSGWVSVDALVDALLFLASPAARGLQGVALPVFGGG